MIIHLPMPTVYKCTGGGHPAARGGLVRGGGGGGSPGHPGEVCPSRGEGEVCRAGGRHKGTDSGIVFFQPGFC